MPLLQSPPGSRRGRSTEPTQYRSRRSDSFINSIMRRSKVTVPLPRFGIDRMGDFDLVGTANLWKSRPLFSTGAMNTELVNVGLRLNLGSPARNTRMALRAREHEEMDGDFGPRLSTAFAEGGRPLHPGGPGSGNRS